MIFGRKETFALEVRPLGGPPPEGDPSAAATWTATRMYVAGRNVFRNGNRDGGTTSEEVRWPAIGLARWFVRSWPQLFHGGAWANRSLRRNARDAAARMDQELIEDLDAPDEVLDARDAFVQTHALRAAAAGGAFPDLWFARDHGQMSVSWYDSMDGEIYFTLPKGEADIPDVDFADAVRGFVTWVAELLAQAPQEGRVIEDAALLRRWLDRFESRDAAIEAVLEETKLSGDRWRRLASAAGVSTVDPIALLALPEPALRKGTMVDASASAIALAFRCTSPTLDDDELVAVRHAILEVPPSARGFASLGALATAVDPPSTGTQDFVRGYHLAREIRRVRRIPTDPLDIEALLADLGIPVMDLPLSDVALDGGCVCDPTHGPAVFVNPRSRRARVPWGRRMVLAHELCHLLFDREHAVALGVISGPWAPPRIERTANAFAIELLLPLAGIEQTVGRAWDDPSEEAVRALMERYGLGTTAVTRHLINLEDPRNR